MYNRFNYKKLNLKKTKHTLTGKHWHEVSYVDEIIVHYQCLFFRTLNISKLQANHVFGKVGKKVSFVCDENPEPGQSDANQFIVCTDHESFKETMKTLLVII